MMDYIAKNTITNAQVLKNNTEHIHIHVLTPPSLKLNRLYVYCLEGHRQKITGNAESKLDKYSLKESTLTWAT